MRKGKMITQGGHAIQYLILDNCFDNADPTRGPLKPSARFIEWAKGDHDKITVGIDSYAQLQAIAKHAAAASIPAYIVTDLGKTDIPALTDTCVVLGPATDEEFAPITGHLKNL